MAAATGEERAKDEASTNKSTPQVMRVRTDERNVDKSRSVMGTGVRSSVGRVKTNRHRKRDHLVSQKATDLPVGFCLNQALTSLIQSSASRPFELFPNNSQGGKKKDIYIVSRNRGGNLYQKK